ncbi:metal-dependent hydrolase [Cognatishimia sp. F0-27]|uniref:metal-dependent hydrolase n=1 Tax=Cognatishimia sp. F0-27 TaxID=2816855 RepID=UPI001D0C1788|nr:metal-dependent hydrolase [Cognatishimia sp. F0-27]MCC1493288.1 metal-dependent hydrolase [Cognatishimia sp. F0-27]
MMIAHLPAGYLLATGLDGRVATLAFWGVLFGSIAPDLDMLWFFFVDQGASHHHGYITHRPAFWLFVLLAGVVTRNRFIAGAGVGALFHLLLDSIVGEIAWAWPISDATWPLVIVPATQNHWILSFLFHWTFLVELVVLACAALVFISRRRVR